MRNRPLPYGRHLIDDADIQAVCDVLRSDWLTCGPLVAKFEDALGLRCGAPHAVAVCNGTAALHCALSALGVGPGDEVVVPTLTFCATANAVVFQGGTPVFADVASGTLLADSAAVEACITPRTKGIVAVDFAGQPCDYDSLRALADRHGLFLVADACHSLGGAWQGRPVGSLADVTCLSFHPVKHITTGEGGMALTADAGLARRMRRFRGHGIDSDLASRAAQGSWRYEMVDLGHNYRITDIQCALGLSQLQHLDAWVSRRAHLAELYTEALAAVDGVSPLQCDRRAMHAWHLFVVRVFGQGLSPRDRAFQGLRERGVLANVHYMPVHMHSFYTERGGWQGPGCPQSEAAFQEVLSLPLHPGMQDQDVAFVVQALRESLER